MTLRTYDVMVIVPKEATNLVTNPTPRSATTGYTASGAGVSIARSTTYSRRRISSIEVTTATGVTSGLYYSIAMTSGTQYSFSADILDVAGQTFNLFIGDNSTGALKSSNVTWTGTGYWKRRSVTWTADASATFRLYITRSSVASTTKFYVDGFQCETGAVSTYIDGDQVGYVVGETAYRWNGTPGASTSWRSGQTRSGGTYMHISSYMKILTVVGLGMAEITNISVPSTLGGSFYQTTVPNERPFTVVGNVHQSGDYGLIEKARSSLIDAVKPDLCKSKQPLLLQIDQTDENSLEIAETLRVKCSYESGLENDGEGDSYNEKIGITFRQFVPYIQQEGRKGTALGYQTSVSNANRIIKRGVDGTWAEMAGGANSGVFAIVYAPDGSIYVGGAFTNLGDANGDYISKWNGSAWSSLGTGMNGLVRALAVGPDGTLYAGGDFTVAGGVADTAHIAKWDGSNWTPLSTGTSDIVYAIVVGLDGSVYLGGAFTNLGDANGDHISKWNGSAFVSLGTGINNDVYTLAVGPDGSIYAGGYFTAAGGVSDTAHIAKWNGTAWVAMGAGSSGTVYSIATWTDGSVYANGVFGGVGGIGKWNGTSWTAYAATFGFGVVRLITDRTGQLYVAGKFSTIGGFLSQTDIAIWNGSAWMPSDVILPTGTANVYAIAFDPIGNFYVGYDGSGTAYSATITVPTVGSATAYPKVVFTGPGTLYQLKNYTTGKAIFFNLTLLAGETAVLNLDPQNIQFWSTFRGNLLSTILPGSDLTFEMLPGANNISAYMYGSTSAATEIILLWSDQYWSVDGAVR